MLNLLAIPHAASVALTVVLIVLGVVLLLWCALGLVFFFLGLGSKRREDENVPAKNSLFEKRADNKTLQAGYKWFDETYKQSVTIPARDKKKNLHAVEFRNPSNSNTWAICIHGWTNVKREMGTLGRVYYERGYNVLIPELRGHGDSESRFVTMGWMDRLDITDWIYHLVRENPNCRIILHGISMGAATTMMTTGEKLPPNVVCAVEDCGFSSVYDIFEDQAIRVYHVPPKILLPIAGFWNRLINGFSFKKASSIEQLKKSKTPTLFIHGDKDNFVLPENLDKVYDACAAPKAKCVIHGAEHAVSVMEYPEEYWKAIDEFESQFEL